MDKSVPVVNTARRPSISHSLSIREVTNDPNDAINPETQTATTQFEILEPATQEEIEYPARSKLILIIMAIVVSLALIGLDFNIVATAVPAITTHFKTISDVGWYYAAYRFTSCSFQFMFGKMYSIFSLKVVFLTALCIFELGSALSGSASSSAALVLGRAISGLGAGGMISGIFTMIHQSIPLRQRPIIGGTAAAFEDVASLAAPLLGGALTDRISWRWCFYINLPLGVIAFLAIYFFFENPRVQLDSAGTWKEKLDKIDIVGTAIFVPSIISLLLALQWGGSKYGWQDARIIVLLILSGALISAFAFQQYRRGEKATLPLRIIGQRSLISGMWFSFCNNSSLSVIEYYMPIYFQVVRGASATKSGVLCLSSVVGFFASALLAGSATSMLGYYTPFMIATSIITPISAGLFTTLKVNASIAKLIGYQALLGFGTGVGFQAPQVAAQTVFSQRDAPVAISAVIFAQNFGPAIFVPVANTIFTERLNHYVEAAVPGLNSTVLDSVGLLDLRDYVKPEQLSSALFGFDMAVTRTFFLPVALTIATVFGTLGMEWKSVKQKQS
ncbi:permease of the major facilitator superfamily [Xylogone sp. PMI_703]|nr:permease of the major facilitator superfamily [Xylogone sp. PMI_703]